MTTRSRRSVAASPAPTHCERTYESPVRAASAYDDDLGFTVGDAGQGAGTDGE